MENKIKLFEDMRIRYAWDAEREEWFFSIADVVKALTDSADEKQYLKKMKMRDAKDEVDFVLVKGENVVGIEVKSGRRMMNRGLSVFKEAFHPKYVYVVGSGGIPIEDFLQLDLNLLFG